MSETLVTTEKEFLFTDADFQFITQFVYEKTGINLTKDKRELVYGRLTKRLRLLGLVNFGQYCDLLRAGDEGEIINLINAITTNVTNFFRENHHFEYLDTTLIPELVKKNSDTLKPMIRAWSAGCSSGNEPYSIAIVLKECLKNMSSWDVKVLATDLDSNILDVARKGVYQNSCIEKVSDYRKRRWFKNGSGANEGTVKIIDELAEIVSYKQLNLMDDWPMTGKFDFIFCRNVAIYFDNQTREKIIDRFADQLHDGGYLFVGHSETLFGVSERFQSIGKTIYKKVK